LFKKLFSSRKESNLLPKSRFERLLQIVRETKIVPESYTIEIGLAQGLEASEIIEIINTQKCTDSNAYDEWCIETIISSIISEKGFINIQDYKSLINIVYRYGFNVEIIDLMITKSGELRNKHAGQRNEIRELRT
jgi:hypothetical protein